MNSVLAWVWNLRSWKFKTPAQKLQGQDRFAKGIHPINNSVCVTKTAPKQVAIDNLVFQSPEFRFVSVI